MRLGDWLVVAVAQPSAGRKDAMAAVRQALRNRPTVRDRDAGGRRRRYRGSVPVVRLRFLGPPRVERGSQEITFDTRKAIALLAVLAVRGEPQSRETLAALLWPEHDEAHAGGALRRTLSVARSGLGGNGLAVQGRTIDLGASAWTDVGQLTSTMAAVRAHHAANEPACDRCLGRLRRVPALVRGRFLEGFTLRDSPEFDDWVAETAASLEGDAAEAFDRLADALAATGEPADAVAVARRRLRLDPLHEAAHRRVMELLAAAGDRAGAIRQYRECVRVLDDELGVAPLPETTALYQRIAAGGAAVDQAAPAAAPLAEPVHRGTMPFVGRVDEMSVLQAAWRASGDGGRLVLLEGEPGIGKSRLVDELQAQLSGTGVRILGVRAQEGETALPYAPLAESIGATLAEESGRAALASQPDWVLGELTRIVPGAASLRPGLPSPPPIDGPGAEVRLVDALARAVLAVVAGPRPGLVFLDDAQWADAATLGVVAYLARRLARQPHCLVVARRAPDPGTDALADVVAATRRAGLLVELHPARLSLDEVADLAARVDAPIPVESLYAETEGIPFYVAEYLAVADGRQVGSGTPIGIRELVARRIAALSEAAQQVLAAAAVIGRSFDLELVRATSGRSASEVTAAVDELVAQGVVRETVEPDGSPAYDFDHAKTRELAYESSSLARRRLLHRRAALALQGPEGRRARRARAAAIARHLRAAGDEHAAARYLRIAGDEAAAVFAHAEALEQYRAALALDPADPATLHERIGDLETLLGGYDEAVRSYESAAASTPAGIAWHVEQRLAAVHGRRGEWLLAQAHLEAALEGVPPGDAASRAWLLSDASLVAHRLGRSDDARALAGQALSLAEAAGDGACLAQAHNLLGILDRSAGALDRARGHLQESLRLATAGRRDDARIAALNNLALVARSSGQAAEAVRLAREALDAAVTIGDRHREAALRNNLADALHADGRRDEALSELKTAVALFAEIGQPGAMEPEIWKLVDW
jgi:DNA-binding SARP family transcriptional activator